MLPPGLGLSAAGAAAIASLFVLYARYQDPALFTPDAAGPLVRMAYMFYVVLAVSLGAVACGLYRYHRARALGPPGLLGTIARATWNGRSRRIFAATFAVYGVLFSLSSGTLVYQPEISFSYHYGAEIPSAFVAPCCDRPGYMPTAIAYITDNVGLQVVPVNLVLQLAVSYLVGLNMALAAGAISAARGTVGAATGLFIACPTCAGTFLSFFAGTTGGILAAAALAQLQTALIAVSIPVLLATPFIIARRIRA